MKRIIIHWTAGGWRASSLDREHYHFLVEGDGGVVEGHLPPLANTTTRGEYAMHTLNLNTGSIGVAFAAMHGARERPFERGASPITLAQVQGMAALCARLCKEYGIPVSRETVLTHAEVEPTLGVPQRGKWDVRWLPGMTGVGKPVEVGDMLRARIGKEMDPPPHTGFWTALINLLTGGRA